MTKAKPKKKPVRKPAKKKPVKRARKPTPPPPPKRERARCERCCQKFWEDELRWTPDGLWCQVCNTRWYAFAVSPGEHEEAVARKIRKAARDRGVQIQVLVPRHIVNEYTKTTWRVWRDENARSLGYRIPEGENDREVLRSFGLLGFITAETEEQARDYARRKFPNDFDRVVELHSPGGKPRVLSRAKFPGYSIFKAEYTKDVHKIVHGTDGVIGVLPVCPNPYNGFRYPRKEPKQRRKPQRWELDAAAAWQPTPLDTQEEVEKLLEEKQIVKDTPRKIEFKFPAGTRVQIVSGQWKDTIGTVEAVSDENPPKLVVAWELFGRKMSIKVEMWQVIKVEG